MQIVGTAPRRLKALYEAHVASGRRVQKPIEWRRERWRIRLPEYEDFLQPVPCPLHREAVRTIAKSPRSDDDAVKGFLAAMIWGYGNTGYGPWRVRQALDGRAGLPDALLEAATMAKVDAVAAYRVLAELRPPRIGPAFGTKYLYFCVSETEQSPLILDRLVARWLRQHAGLQLNPVPWSTSTYDRYVAHMRPWAHELDILPSLAEELIFRDTAGGQWSDPLQT